VTDANGCHKQDTATLTGPHGLSLTLAATNAACYGTPTGSVNLTVTGGTAPFAYQWNTGATTEDVAQLTTGSYAVTVTDVNGCTGMGSASISQPTQLSHSLSKSVFGGGYNVSCHGGSDGFVNLTVNGGTPPYSYQWSNGATTEDVQQLSAGVHFLTITDAQGCVRTDSVALSQPPPLTATTSVTHVSCYGLSDGSATVSASGGIPPYSYNWGTTTISGLSAGTYAAIVTDANGCQAVAYANIGQPNLLVADIQPQHISCNGANDGSATVQITGGTPLYHYQWSNGATTNAISGLNIGYYRVTITDQRGCTAADSTIITEPNTLQVHAAKTDVSCYGSQDGAVDVTITGGMAPFTYQWSTGATTANISGLPVGAYSISVNDANGCTGTAPRKTPPARHTSAPP